MKISEWRIFIVVQLKIFKSTIHRIIEYDRKTMTVVGFHKDFNKITICSYGKGYVLLHTKPESKFKMLKCTGLSETLFEGEDLSKLLK